MSCREFNAEVPTRLSHGIFSPNGRWLVGTSVKQLGFAVSVDARRLQVWDLVELRRQFRDLGVDWKSDP